MSGAAALVYEVVWTRMLTLTGGHSVAATSTTLAAFMGGLAAGSWIAGRYSDMKFLLWIAAAFDEHILPPRAFVGGRFSD